MADEAICRLSRDERGSPSHLAIRRSVEETTPQRPPACVPARLRPTAPSSAWISMCACRSSRVDLDAADCPLGPYRRIHAGGHGDHPCSVRSSGCLRDREQHETSAEGETSGEAEGETSGSAEGQTSGEVDASSGRDSRAAPGPANLNLRFTTISPPPQLEARLRVTSSRAGEPPSTTDAGGPQRASRDTPGERIERRGDRGAVGSPRELGPPRLGERAGSSSWGN